jgi:RNA polymerase sigma-70 factor (ECF subfamily)
MKSSVDFEMHVESFASEIYAYLWRMLRNKEDAEDCLQETFLRAYRAYSRLDPTANHRAWFYKIATNVANNFFRKQARRVPHQVELNDESMSGTFHEAFSPEMREQVEHIRVAVAELPNKQRAALILRKYHGFNYAEISSTLDCSESSARANVYQALKKLRAKFQPVDEVSG